MYTFQSSEIRWFYQEGKHDIEALHAWFLNIPGATINKQSTRVDYYYRLPQSPHFGIKLRMEGGGKAETKEQIRDYGPVNYHPKLGGVVNDWIKWSFALAEPDVRAEMLEPSWIAVEKERWQQRYWIDRNSGGQVQIAPLASDEFSAAGFSIEFTKIRAGNQLWFSIGFEAHDPGKLHRENLDAGIQYILDLEETPLFEVVDSMSYYGWLSDRFSLDYSPDDSELPGE